MSQCSCGCTSEGCAPNKEEKKVVVDFLYLDLSVCERCQDTERNLDEAIHDASAVLKAAGYDIAVNKVHIDTKELAIKYELSSSPTIRINGEDIALAVKESPCEECGDLCGEDVDCRVWQYEGEEYTSPPKAMIINAILNAIFTDRPSRQAKEEYKLPQNLELFFDEGENHR